MMADCETCTRKQVPCKSCQESQRSICYRCDGDVDDPYFETCFHDWDGPVRTIGNSASRTCSKCGTAAMDHYKAHPMAISP